MSWLSARPNIPKPATWEETNGFYKDFSLSFTVSEYDREHKPVVYLDKKNSDSDATRVLSHYHIQTHQGILKCYSFLFFFFAISFEGRLLEKS